MGPLRAALDALSRGFDRGAEQAARLAGLGYLAVALLIGLEVVGRNFLGVSTQSSIELSGYVLGVGIAWGLGGALVARAHIRIDVALQMTRGALRCGLDVAAMAALTVFAGVLAYGAVVLTQESWLFGATDISALGTPLVIPQGLWAMALGAFFLMCCLRLLQTVMLLPSRDVAAIEALTGPRSYVEEAQDALDSLPPDAAAPGKE